MAPPSRSRVAGSAEMLDTTTETSGVMDTRPQPPGRDEAVVLATRADCCGLGPWRPYLAAGLLAKGGKRWGNF